MEVKFVIYVNKINSKEIKLNRKAGYTLMDYKLCIEI